MRKDPFAIAWKIEAESHESIANLAVELAPLASLSTSLSDQSITLPGGREVVQTQRHEVGDYFDRLCILPATTTNGPSLRLFFQRKPQAGRVWKDVMAFVLRQATQLNGKVWIGLDYRVDDEQIYSAAADVPNWFSHLGDDSRKFWKASATYLLDHPRFSFADLERELGIDSASLKAMHRNSYRAIRREQAANPLWEMKDYALHCNVYMMEPVVRDEILCLSADDSTTLSIPSVAS